MVDSLTLKYEFDYKTEAGDNLRAQLVAINPQGDLIAILSDIFTDDRGTLRVIRLATGDLEFEVAESGRRPSGAAS